MSIRIDEMKDSVIQPAATFTTEPTYNIIVLTFRVNTIWGRIRWTLFFQDRKMEKICNDKSLLVRKYGPKRAQLLRLRLGALRVAENLEAMRWLPQVRCHELIGDRAGALAVDLDHPYRLIFEPANAPIPRKPDGGLDWTAVTAIRVLAVTDYH